ncbi:hypothetical protein [Vibrio phage vB_VpaP_SJSY21]|nr:hypothetical protein [Vibrio phage vB_VpaP_SJSY21]
MCEFLNLCPLCSNPLGNICPATCVVFCDKCGTSETTEAFLEAEID